MKKLLTLGLSLLAVIAALSLSACGQQGETGTDTGTNQTTPEGGAGGTGGTTEGAAPAAPEGGTGGTGGTTEGGTGGGQ
ncbi:MAG: hypothetical protein WHS44_03740 [Fimbriimonadales bacterium]|nr:MAG: hypothetical protein KatS3mg018_1791 [Fimbriimonadales bacterium]